MIRFTAMVAVSLCALMIGAAAAEAQYFGRNKVHPDRLDFRLLQTDHFDIHYYAEEEEATRHAARMAERWYARFSRVLDHTFARRQPLVLYASHPHFSQTNLTAGSPGEGTGGFTERNKSRIAMPFAAGLGETDHVLGHEIAHAFQIEIAKSARQNAFTLPGWLIEGMAEYLSLGAESAHTAMWVRDAALHDRLPTLKQLDDARYFPYRYGHALWSYLAGRYGDAIIVRVLRSKASGGVLGKLEEATGIDDEQITKEWHASIDAPVEGTRRSFTDAITDDGDARMQVAPALSPDGRHLMFMSERDRLSLDLFMSDTASRKVVRKIVSTAADPHFDSLQYIHSAGAWDAEGRQFAVTALSAGEPVLVVVDMARDAAREEVRFPGVGEIYTPTWSPDGSRLVVSALKGGLSDLFIYTLRTRALTQLTADAFADLHPSWSPDGRTIAFATDRFTSSLDELRFGPLRVGLLDLATGVVRPLRAVGDGTGRAAVTEGTAPVTVAGVTIPVVEDLQASVTTPVAEDLQASVTTPVAGDLQGSGPPPSAKEVSPQWAPDGSAIYFVSDRNGTSNVYRMHLRTGELYRLTDVRGGVSGVTATSPALAVASKAGSIAFSLYENGRYRIQMLGGCGTDVSRRRDESNAGPACAGVALAAETPASLDSADEDAQPPAAASAARSDDSRGTLAGLLADAAAGLPPPAEFPTSEYDDRLRLESVSQPFVGAASGNSFGGLIRASFGVTFGDLLRDRQLQTAIRVGTDVDDFAAQIAYTNRKARWNWGVSAGFVPSRFYGARRALTHDGDLVTRETTSLRYMHQWSGFTARYNIDRARRVELGAGLRRTGFVWQTVTRITDEAGHVVSRDLDESPAGRPIYLAETHVAFVHDTSVFGMTSPVLGQRLRLEIEPALGALTFADVRVDARRYFMPFRPVTIAARVAHVGRYGRNAADPRLTPLVLGLQTLVRGYDLRSFAADECGRSATECSMMDELTGSRLGLLNIELRAPLMGLLDGKLDYGGIPVEALAFVDAGFLWTRQQSGAIERDRFRSVGAGARANLGGFVFEMTAVRPFDRARQGWTVNFLLTPGW